MTPHSTTPPRRQDRSETRGLDVRSWRLAVLIAALLLPASLWAGADEGGEWVELKKGLMMQELVVGDGAEATHNSFVQVHYVGSLEDGSVFDRSKESGFAFKIGEGRVIRGWEMGVKGMKVGGKRKLKIPHKLGYGSKGVPGRIPPKATLIFEIELISSTR